MRACPRAAKTWTARSAPCAPSGAMKSTVRRRQARRSRAARSWRKLSIPRQGCVRVIAEWDRATRSMMDGVHIIERIHARGLNYPESDLAGQLRARAFQQGLEERRWTVGRNLR